MRFRCTPIALLGLLLAGPVSAEAPTAANAWARATPPGADVAAVYVTLHGGKEADRLLGASTPRASMTHLHSMAETGGMARMRPVEGVDVPPGKNVALEPNGLHLMLMGLERPLVAGERFPLTLQFARGGDRTVEVRVQSPTDPPPSAKP